MKNTNLRHNQSGSAMLISLMALMLMTMLGMAMMTKTNTEKMISAHGMRSTQALYNSEAGIGEVLARMSNASDTTNYIGQQQGDWNTEPGWGRYVVLANGNRMQDPDGSLTEFDGLDNNGNGQIDEAGERYPEISSKQGGDALDYPWVKVHYKLNGTNQLILFGDHDNDATTPDQANLINGAPIIVITASGAQGSANRTVQVEAVQQLGVTFDSAVYFEDSDIKFNGTQFLVSGQDWDPITGSPIAGNPEVPGISSIEDASDIAEQLTNNQLNNVEGEGGDPSVADASLDLDMDALSAKYGAEADIVLPGGLYSTMSDWGDWDDYKVVHITGTAELAGNTGGAGVLLVDGDLSILGQFQWYGVVIVMGDFLTSGGGQGIHIYGSTLVKGGGDLGRTTIGGNANLLYSSAALAKLATMGTYTVYNWREL